MRDVKRWPILAALGTFLVGGGVAVVRGILSGAYMGRAQAWALGNTISYYVGTSTWAAVMFAVLNFVTVLLIGYYLWQLGQVWQMSRIYYHLVVILAVAFVWLSVCPVYYADYMGHVSLVSRIHEVASRTMFVMMALIVLLVVLNRTASTGTRALGVVYLMFAIVSVLGYLTNGAWFTPAILVWESSYILAFLLVMIVARERVSL